MNTNVPNPEWQYRLLPCLCGVDDAEYILNVGKPELEDALFYVRCCACGRKTQPHICAHDAQQEWNDTYRASVGRKLSYE